MKTVEELCLDVFGKKLSKKIKEWSENERLVDFLKKSTLEEYYKIVNYNKKDFSLKSTFQIPLLECITTIFNLPKLPIVREHGMNYGYIEFTDGSFFYIQLEDWIGDFETHVDNPFFNPKNLFWIYYFFNVGTEGDEQTKYKYISGHSGRINQDSMQKFFEEKKKFQAEIGSLNKKYYPIFGFEKLQFPRLLNDKGELNLHEVINERKKKITFMRQFIENGKIESLLEKVLVFKTVRQIKNAKGKLKNVFLLQTLQKKYGIPFTEKTVKKQLEKMKSVNQICDYWMKKGRVEISFSQEKKINKCTEITPYIKDGEIICYYLSKKVVKKLVGVTGITKINFNNTFKKLMFNKVDYPLTDHQKMTIEKYFYENFDTWKKELTA